MSTDTWLDGNGQLERWAAISLGRPPASTDTAIINSGSASTGTSAITVAGLTQSGGTVSGSSTLTVTGRAVFSDGVIQIGTDTTVIKGASQLDGTSILRGPGDGERHHLDP